MKFLILKKKHEEKSMINENHMKSNYLIQK